MQIAKSFGARVTGVYSTRNLDLVHSLDADRVIDYTREDFTTGSDRYDIVLDCHANRPLLACASILVPTASYVFVGAPGRGLIGPLREVLKVFALAPFVRRTLTVAMVKPNQRDLAFIADLMNTGSVIAAIGSMKCHRRLATSNRATHEEKSSSPLRNGSALIS